MFYNKETLKKSHWDYKKWHNVYQKSRKKTFKIPKSTLGNKIAGKYEVDSKMGRKPALPENVENKLVTALKEAARQGIWISRQLLLKRTGELSKRLSVSPLKKIHPLKDCLADFEKDTQT